ncbi:MAG: aminopeptidase P family protein [Chlorobi bacterium]|nr:aminopeptidase P family protein [Chlorobiota bacterium]
MVGTRRFAFRFLPLLAAFLVFNHALEAQDVSAREYAQRRLSVIEKMDSGAVAVYLAGTLKNRSNDMDFEFVQDKNFLYLTGYPDPGAILFLSKDEFTRGDNPIHALLFVPPSNPATEQWVGKHMSGKEARTVLGLRSTASTTDFRAFMDSTLKTKRLLYYDPRISILTTDKVLNVRLRTGREFRKAVSKLYPELTLKSAFRLAASLRARKSPAELRLMQKAINATVDAHLEAFRSAEPGMFEYELEAVIEYCFRRKGCDGPAFPSIVGSGPNSTTLHYEKNTRRMRKGDMVVMDVGAEYEGYSADVTRTIPVSGVFRPEQRELYEIVLKAREATLAAVKPGVRLFELTNVAREIIDAAGFGRYFNHSVSHHLGLDTHDPVGYGPLREGNVITIEPGIYVPEGADVDHKYWNIGIRIEDDVLVTKDGYELLTKDLPVEIEAIEAIMAEEGIGNLPVGREKNLR